MNPDSLAGAARLLLEARRTGRGIKGFPLECKPLTAEDANEIVDEVTRQLGEEIAGWKITFLYKPRERPFVPRFLARACCRSPARVPVAFAPSRFIEPEITFRLTRDVPPRAKLYRTAGDRGCRRSLSII